MPFYMLAFTLGLSLQNPAPALPQFGQEPVGSCQFDPQVPTVSETGERRPKKDLLNLIFNEERQKELWFANYAALDRGYASGELVRIATDPARSGVQLRTWGKYPIAEKAKTAEAKHRLMGLRLPAAGLLYYLADQYRQRFIQRFGEEWQNQYRPLELTSLVRSEGYQQLLIGKNPNANVKKQNVPPLHVLGLAFDIGRGDLTITQDRILLELLTEMESRCELMYSRESAAQAAYHVVALPQTWEVFSQIYSALVPQALPAANGKEK